jgi:hypothetical protein
VELEELLRLELVVAVLDDVLLRLEVVVLLVLVDAFVEVVLLLEVRLDAALFDVELPFDGCDEVATEEAPVEAPVDPVLLRAPDVSDADAGELLLSPNPPAGSGDVPQPGITRSAAHARPRPLLDTRMLIAWILHRPSGAPSPCARGRSIMAASPRKLQSPERPGAVHGAARLTGTFCTSRIPVFI